MNESSKQSWNFSQEVKSRNTPGYLLEIRHRLLNLTTKALNDRNFLCALADRSVGHQNGVLKLRLDPAGGFAPELAFIFGEECGRHYAVTSTAIDGI